MKVARRLKAGLGAIAAGVMLGAGPAAEARAALTYEASLGAGVVVDDNLHLDPPSSGGADQRQPVKETIFTIDPAVMVSWAGEHDRLRLRYSGEYSMFDGDEERDPLWIQTVAAELNWRRWSPFFLEAVEERSRVPRTQDGNIEGVVDQVDRNLLTVRTGLVSEIGLRSSVELGYHGELETYSGSGGGLDHLQRHAGEVLVRHRWTPLWSGEASAAYGRVDRELAPGFDELRVSAAVSQRWSERTAMRYRLEWIREDDDESAGGGVSTTRANLLKAVDIGGDLAAGGSWSLAYEDRLAGQPDGDTLRTGRTAATAAFRTRLGSTLSAGGWYETRDYRDSGREEAAWGPTLGARWTMAPWAALELAGSWTSTTIRQEGLPEIEDRTSRASAGLVFLLFKRVQLEAGYRYGENDSTEATRSYASNVVYALATCHFRPVLPGGRSLPGAAPR